MNFEQRPIRDNTPEARGGKTLGEVEGNLKYPEGIAAPSHQKLSTF